MISLSLLFAAIALSDLRHGGASETSDSLRSNLLWIAAPTVGAVIAYFAMGACAWHSLILGGLVLASTGTWHGFRRTNRNGAALCSLAIGLSFAIVGNTLLGTEASLESIEPQIAALPWHDADRSLDFYLLAASIMGMLAATGNAIVRSVLLMASDASALERSESRLRGGRYIGVLERYLIFGLALAGEPTAAALVISAKSIIRFPELSARGQSTESQTLNDTDEITEYFLLGSLTSWTIALAPTALLLAIAH